MFLTGNRVSGRGDALFFVCSKLSILPDFATGAILINPEQVLDSLKKGTGFACKLRSVVEFDPKLRAFQVKELPYGVYTQTISEEIQKLGLLKSLNVRGRYTHKVSISRDLDLDDSEGYAFVSFKKIEYEYGIVNDENIGKALSYLEGEIGDYNKWLSGDVYGFMLYKKVKCECCSHIEYEDLDSCWCFYGDDMEINGMLESIGLSSEELDELLKEENEEVA